MAFVAAAFGPSTTTTTMMVLQGLQVLPAADVVAFAAEPVAVVVDILNMQYESFH